MEVASKYLIVIANRTFYVIIPKKVKKAFNGYTYCFQILRKELYVITET